MFMYKTALKFKPMILNIQQNIRKWCRTVYLAGSSHTLEMLAFLLGAPPSWQTKMPPQPRVSKTSLGGGNTLIKNHWPTNIE